MTAEQNTDDEPISPTAPGESVETEPSAAQDVSGPTEPEVGVGANEADSGELLDGDADGSAEGLRLQLQQRDDALLRLQAELENLRKRARRDVENAHKFGVEKLIGELLPVKDSMELGLATEEGADSAALREGVQLTDKMLAGVLEKFGVQVLDPTDEAFDPERHQAMTMQEIEGTPAGKVVTVFQKGYVLNERLVRPAMVIVSK
jgi:molecular chaperone GrpE